MKLTLGQKIYKCHFNSYSLLIIERVTKTQAILSDGTKLKIEYNPEWSLQEIGRNTWSHTLFHLPNEHHDSKYLQQKIDIYFGRCMKVTAKISNEDKQKVIDILSPYLTVNENDK
jgi:hypothetical protein